MDDDSDSENGHFGEQLVSIVLDDSESDNKVQLGASIHLNDTLESQFSPREVVTEKSSTRRHFYFNIRCKRPVFGTASTERGRDVPACRVVLDAAFVTGLTKRQFRSAMIKVSFEDDETAELQSGKSGKEVTGATGKYQPQILAFEPKKWCGCEDVRDGQVGIKAQLSTPSKASVGISRIWPIVEVGQSQIEGIRGSSSSEIQWKLQQNNLRCTGIVSQFSLPMLVQYTPGRPFVARVEVTAEVEWGFGKMISGKLDDPLRFDPEWLSADDDRADLREDLKAYCNLGGLSGEFIY